MNSKILTIAFIFIAITLNPSVAAAQTVAPVDAEFFGAWTFDYAQAQERPANSNQSYVTRNVSQDEFWQKPQLLSIPTQIVFMGAFLAHISHPSWSYPVATVMNNGLLEFRHFQENDFSGIPDLSEIHSYPAMTPAHLLTKSGNLMRLQSNYTDTDAQGNPIEGILTVYYRK